MTKFKVLASLEVVESPFSGVREFHLRSTGRRWALCGATMVRASGYSPLDWGHISAGDVGVDTVYCASCRALGEEL